ncbi:MAG TPA: hypothetical protein VNS29_15315 [Burkholderiaceae bacterium]|nr:hypothetical protein [Burkholderiaceae bacterium]
MDVLNMISTLTQGLGAYKAAVQTLDDAKIAAATNELTVQLAHVGAHVLAMQEKAAQATEREGAHLARMRDLEEQVRKLEKRNRDFERYKLVEPYPGTYALLVEESARNGEPEHYLCPGCRDNRGVKSILQFDGDKKRFAKCPECQHSYRFRDGSSIGAASVSWMD